MHYTTPAKMASCGVMEAIEKIKKLMTERGLNQSDLAEMTGASRQKISLVLNGGANLKSYQMLRLARGLGVDLEYLVDVDMDDPKPSSHLSDDERAVIQVYRALRPQLDETKAIRALAAASNVGTPKDERKTQQGDPITEAEIQATKRRRQA